MSPPPNFIATEAIRLYTQAIAGDDQDVTLFSNRSAAYLNSGLHQEALWDAEKCVKLQPEWPKGLYRLGMAATALCQWTVAQHAFMELLRVKAGDPDASARLKEVEWVLQRRASAREAQRAVERRAIVAKLREVRSDHARETALRQFKQSMTGPDWELEDLDWRPTFLPSMRAASGRLLADGQHRSLARAYILQLADLAAPKAALEVLSDEPRWRALESALVAQSQQQHRAVVLEAGSGGMLGLVTARALPQASVISVQRGRMLYLMAKQILTSNRAVVPNLSLADCTLAKLCVDEEEESAEEGFVMDRDETGVSIDGRADLLVTDMLDYGYGLHGGEIWISRWLLC